MESMGSSNRPSFAAQESSTKGKPKRRYVSRSKSEQGSDTPQHENFPIHPSITGLSREERIKLYQMRAESKGKKGNPVNIFTDEEYKDDEIKGTLYQGDEGYGSKKGK